MVRRTRTDSLTQRRRHGARTCYRGRRGRPRAWRAILHVSQRKGCPAKGRPDPPTLDFAGRKQRSGGVRLRGAAEVNFWRNGARASGPFFLSRYSDLNRKITCVEPCTSLDFPASTTRRARLSVLRVSRRPAGREAALRQEAQTATRKTLSHALHPPRISISD